MSKELRTIIRCDAPGCPATLHVDGDDPRGAATYAAERGWITVTTQGGRCYDLCWQCRPSALPERDVDPAEVRL